MCFEGGTLRVNKGLNSHFQVSHTLNLPTNPQSPSGYKFGATYVGTKMLSPSEVCILKLGLLFLKTRWFSKLDCTLKINGFLST